MADGAQDIATFLAAAFDGAGGAVAPPIAQTSLFTFDSYQAFEDRMAGRTKGALYTRVQNPTVAAFEALMAGAEGGDAAIGFASGMGAISSTLLAFLKPGDRVACVEHVYPDTYRFFERLLVGFGIEVSYHPVAAFEDDADLLKGAALAYLESPTSVMFQPMDLAKVAAHARRHGVLTAVDNSWASPVLQNPLQLGIDLCLHSASKYISGHSDTVAGAVVARAELIERIRDLTLPLLGAKLAPFDAFLLTRGLRTLSARMARHQATADLFVQRCAAHPSVSAVHSPPAGSAPGLRGRSGLLSIELDPGIDIPSLCDRLRLFKLGVSWGGFESLVLPARIGLAQSGQTNSMRRFGVPPTLLRLSLGLEDAEELWADFEHALGRSATK